MAASGDFISKALQPRATAASLTDLSRGAKGAHGHKIRIARPLVIASDQADRALEPSHLAARFLATRAFLRRHEGAHRARK
jgi:hypothetical protein